MALNKGIVLQNQHPPKDKFGWHFSNSYAQLPPAFFVRQSPTPVKAPHLILFNQRLALELGLNVDELITEAGVAILSGNRIPSCADPIAQAYAGHQFGHFNILGDGRAILLGEHQIPKQQFVDIQLKGAGVTPYSRRGDGRAALGPMLREYIISESMHALGIPTTLSLAVVSTGEPVYRERVLPGAVLARIASSHIRVGTFQFASVQLGTSGVQALADYSIQRHFPSLINQQNKYSAFLNAVIDRQATLIAKWMSVGFIHGVMNTDNMSIAGETIDYGPCAFMDIYDQSTVFSSIDQLGRYAFGQQPNMGQWNLARFAETLLPLISNNSQNAIQIAQEALHQFSITLKKHWLSLMIKKIGLFDENAGDLLLIQDLLDVMQNQAMDYTYTLRQLAKTIDAPQMLSLHPDFLAWHQRWIARLHAQSYDLEAIKNLMQSHNPAAIPRNHLVEQALSAAEEGSMDSVDKLMQVLARPFIETPDHLPYQLPPPPTKQPYKTFCGT